MIFNKIRPPFFFFLISNSILTTDIKVSTIIADRKTLGLHVSDILLLQFESELGSV